METELRRAFKRLAKSFVRTAPDTARGKGRAYECWVMFALARAFVDDGGMVEALDCRGRPTTKLIIRKNPAPMAVHSDDPKSSPGHLVFSGKSLQNVELHLGMQHYGASGTPHEVDLSIISESHSSWVRSIGDREEDLAPLALLELKAYDPARKLDQSIGRAFLGVAWDILPYCGCDMVVMFAKRGRRPFQTSRWIEDEPDQLLKLLVTTTDVYDNTRRLLEAYSGACLTGIVPPPRGNQVDTGAEAVLNALRSVL